LAVLADFIADDAQHGQLANPVFSVRPDGAVYQWRKVPPSELSVALVADERLGGATRRAEAS